MRVRLVCLAALLLPALAHADAKAEFERLKALVGHWEGTTKSGRLLKADYRTTANGTVLMETWTLGPKSESLTLYHLDGDRLLATHYCPIGNQPRLALEPSKNPDVLSFNYESATNLANPKTSHQQHFDLVFQGPDQFMRDETYREGDEDSSESTTFKRVAKP